MGYWKAWFSAATTRALRTLGQTAVAFIGSAALMGEVNWVQLISTVGLAVILCYLQALAGLPEVTEENTHGKHEGG